MSFVPRKIRNACALSLCVAAALAGWFSPEEYTNPVNIRFSDVATWNSDVVSFTITNRSQKDFVVMWGKQHFPYGPWQDFDGGMVDSSILPGRGSTNCSARVYSEHRTNRWRIAVCFGVVAADSHVNLGRVSLRRCAASFGWNRVSDWIMPKDVWRYSHGPEMLGNKEVGPAEHGAQVNTFSRW